MTRATATSAAAAGAVTVALIVGYFLRGGANERRAEGGAAVASEAPPGAVMQATATTLAPLSPSSPRSATTALPQVPSAPDEASFMAALRALRASNPEAAIDLARRGDERFPDSGYAAERASILVHALASEGRAAEARGEAESVVNRYPDSSWIREIETFTGAHRHRNVHLGVDGGLEIY